MSGFSLDLRTNGKKSSKIKKKGSPKNTNIFGIRNHDKKSNIIKLTHVNELRCQEIEEKPPLIIRPESSLRYSLAVARETEKYQEEPKYGLTNNTNTPAAEVKGKTSIIKNSEKHMGRELNWLEKLPQETQGEEYEEVPVEEFGDALLRGMGWDGNHNVPVTRIPHHDIPNPSGTSRGQYSGIGAKTKNSSDILGSKRHFSTEAFLPIIKVNRKTGKRT